MKELLARLLRLGVDPTDWRVIAGALQAKEQPAPMTAEPLVEALQRIERKALDWQARAAAGQTNAGMSGLTDIALTAHSALAARMRAAETDGVIAVQGDSGYIGVTSVEDVARRLHETDFECDHDSGVVNDCEDMARRLLGIEARGGAT